jgi:phospholipid/cholesterol/gamma-HCH transport system permease protein
MAGAAFLLALEARHGSEASFQGATAQLESLLDRARKAAAAQPTPQTLPVLTFRQITSAGLRAASGSIAFLGEAVVALVRLPLRRRMLRGEDLLRYADQAGVRSMPLLALLGFLIGLILAFQSAVPMRRFGADLYVANLVSISLLRELGPLLAAVILSGRTGSAFAAEIGTMKVNEELNALTTMGLDPVRFLVVTRIIAALLMMPLLTLFADLIGILGGALTMITFNIPIVSFLHEVDSLVDVKDLLAGLAKAPVFAILIAGVGCLRGLQTQTGASAVGISATRAVVSSIVLLVVVDGIYAFVYYLLDI